MIRKRDCRLVNRQTASNITQRIRFLSEQCAYHEAGHAVRAHVLGAKVHMISIDPEWDDEHLRQDGLIEVHWPGDLNGKSMTTFGIEVALAGPAAEMLHIQAPYHPAFVKAWSVDWETAWSLVEPMHKDQTSRMRALERTTRDLYHWFSTDAIWQAVACLVDELLAHEHLESEEVHDILRTWL